MKQLNVSFQESPGAHFATMLRSIRWDSWVFGLILIVFSVPVLTGAFPEKLVFLPDSVLSGEWWRLVTHPFVHVSWYHLLLDGTAFLLLYASLRERAWWRRV